jgi:hypothetical protein
VTKQPSPTCEERIAVAKVRCRLAGMHPSWIEWCERRSRASKAAVAAMHWESWANTAEGNSPLGETFKKSKAS